MVASLPDPTSSFRLSAFLHSARVQAKQQPWKPSGGLRFGAEFHVGPIPRIHGWVFCHVKGCGRLIRPQNACIVCVFSSRLPRRSMTRISVNAEFSCSIGYIHYVVLISTTFSQPTCSSRLGGKLGWVGPLMISCMQGLFVLPLSHSGASVCDLGVDAAEPTTWASTWGGNSGEGREPRALSPSGLGTASLTERVIYYPRAAMFMW